MGAGPAVASPAGAASPAVAQGTGERVEERGRKRVRREREEMILKRGERRWRGGGEEVAGIWKKGKKKKRKEKVFKLIK